MYSASTMMLLVDFSYQQESYKFTHIHPLLYSWWTFYFAWLRACLPACLTSLCVCVQKPKWRLNWMLNAPIFLATLNRLQYVQLFHACMALLYGSYIYMCVGMRASVCVCMWSMRTLWVRVYCFNSVVLLNSPYFSVLPHWRNKKICKIDKNPLKMKKYTIPSTARSNCLVWTVFFKIKMQKKTFLFN